MTSSKRTKSTTPTQKTKSTPRLSTPTDNQKPKQTFAAAKRHLQHIGVTLVNKEGALPHYRVNLAGGVEASAYYTDDLQDAIRTGEDMAKRGAVLQDRPEAQHHKAPVQTGLHTPTVGPATRCNCESPLCAAHNAHPFSDCHNTNLKHLTAFGMRQTLCQDCAYFAARRFGSDVVIHASGLDVDGTPSEINATVERMNRTDAATAHRLQGYTMRGPFYGQCDACGDLISTKRASRIAHEATATHQEALLARQQPNSAWVPWKLAPDSDPQERFILTTVDGEHEHPAGLKFSSGVEACEFLRNNPQFDQPHLRLEGELSPRECATVLHGLRLIQTEGRIEGCAAGDCEHFEDYQPLVNEEIDALAERINLGPVSKAPTERTPGAVRAFEQLAHLFPDSSLPKFRDDVIAIIDRETAAPKVQQSKTWTGPKTPPNAEPYIWMQEGESHAAADCGCILEDDGTGPALYLCETHEAAAATKANLSAAVEHLGTLAECLKEAHSSEWDSNHGGDGAAGCSYCEAIVEADRIAREAIGLEPRPIRHCNGCQQETPIVEDDAEAYCILCGSTDVAPAA